MNNKFILIKNAENQRCKNREEALVPAIVD
jgi:hypothetical protein